MRLGALASVIAGCAAAACSPTPTLYIASSPPPPPPPEPVGWTRTPFHGKPSLEASAAAEVGGFVGGPAFAGGSMRWGGRFALHPSSDTTVSGRIREIAAGDMWGLDVRVHALQELHPVGSPRAWLSAGIAVAADNVLGDPTDRSRVRIPSLLGLALPEIGVVSPLDAPAGFYTAHAFPIHVLLWQRLALEARPAFTLRFSGAPHAPEASLSLSLGLMTRDGRARRQYAE